MQPFTGARDNRLSTLLRFYLSVLHPPFSIFLHACICFTAFHSFPPAPSPLTFHIFPPPFFLVHFFTSRLSLVPPLLLARFSLFSLPHFLCALQWFFRFFFPYTDSLSPDSFYSSLMSLFLGPSISPIGMKVLLPNIYLNIY